MNKLDLGKNNHLSLINFKFFFLLSVLFLDLFINVSFSHSQEGLESNDKNSIIEKQFEKVSNIIEKSKQNIKKSKVKKATIEELKKKVILLSEDIEQIKSELNNFEKRINLSEEKESIHSRLATLEDTVTDAFNKLLQMKQEMMKRQKMMDEAMNAHFTMNDKTMEMAKMALGNIQELEKDELLHHYDESF